MKRICIDLGSATTKIYISGVGVVLNEATCIAVEMHGENGYEVKAYGDKARSLYGRSAKDTRIIQPVIGGDIVNEGLAYELLSCFLGKCEITRKRAKGTEVIFVLPCGSGKELKSKVRTLAERCGFTAVYFTLTPYASVLGQNAKISESKPKFCIDIGRSITNVACVSQDGIIEGFSINLGGGNIDAMLVDEIAEKRGLKIGGRTAERLKNTVGSLLADDNKLNVIEGVEIHGGAPNSIAVSSEQIYGCIQSVTDKILEFAGMLLKKLPAEVASGVMDGGVYLSGGFACLDGLKEYVAEKLKIRVNVSEEPSLCAVIGGGAILADDDLFERFCS